jgi:hypothetical protein
VRAPCMTAAELRLWDAANAICGPRYRADSPCVDCTTAFASEQRAVCNGIPGDLTREERLERQRARRRELRAAA